MNLTTIVISANDQDLAITQKPLLASGDIDSVLLHVDFDSAWDGYAKTAIFYQNANNAYHALLDSNNECLIPWEVMVKEGTMYFGIYGVKDGIQKTTEVLKYNIKQGAWIPSSSPSEPSEDIYKQLLSAYATYSQKAEAIYTNMSRKLWMTASTVTLPHANWVNGLQTVAVADVTEDTEACHILATYAPESYEEYKDCDVRLSSQGNGTLTFSCNTSFVPVNDLCVNVIVCKTANKAGNIEKELKLVKTINGTEPDENGNVYIKIPDGYANAVVVNANGNIISLPDSADMELLGLKLYGRTTQNGTPTPDAPVPLESVGDGGGVGVTVAGKNLYGFEEITFTQRKVIYLDKPLPPGTYAVSAEIVSNATTSQTSIATFLNKDNSNRKTLTFGRNTRDVEVLTADFPVAEIWFMSSSGYNGSAGYTATWSKLQIEAGDKATSYEPYNAQTLSVSTPNGLPGFYVTSDGNYTDKSGRQWVCDEVDFAKGVYVQRIGKIDSYAGEDIPGAYMSTTGDLSDGATILYVLTEAVETALSAEELAQYATLHTNYLTTTIFNDSDAYMEVEYVADTKTYIDAVVPDTFVKPVEKAWEQRMLERIEQTMIPMVALAKLPKAASGYINKGETLTGISYSAVFAEEDGENLVGTQVPLSTYYSALENPASVMYTEDKYQDHPSMSTHYGINCSGFVSYVCGFGEWIWTTKMGSEFADKVIPIADENDLFQIRRGDILLNTVESSGNGDHVMIVRDVVCDSRTGKLLGFNIAESWKPFVRVTFQNLKETLAFFYESQPYRLVRLDDSDFGLTVEPVAYSRSVYPDKGDGGKYSAGESIWLYIPDTCVTSIFVSVDGGSPTVLYLKDMNAKSVNGVPVYEYILDKTGTYTIFTNLAQDDPCEVLVTGNST